MTCSGSPYSLWPYSLVQDREGILLEMSEHLAAFLGYSPEELVGRSVLELVVDPEETRTKLELLEHNGHLGHIAELRHRNGTHVAVAYATEQGLDGNYVTHGRPLI